MSICGRRSTLGRYVSRLSRFWGVQAFFYPKDRCVVRVFNNVRIKMDMYFYQRCMWSCYGCCISSLHSLVELQKAAENTHQNFRPCMSEYFSEKSSLSSPIG